MKKITFVTMQLRTPGGIERFISSLATMLNDIFEIEIIANYGQEDIEPAFPLPKNIKITFLTPIQPKEVSMKPILFGLKWHKIPAELKRRHFINSTQIKAFKNYLRSLKTDYIITDRAHYNNIVSKFYHGSATKIATDHNYHQHNPIYIMKLLKSIKKFNYLIVPSKELRDFYASKTSVKCIFIPTPISDIPIKKSPLTSPNIISVGRLVPEKDFPLLINTMKIIHEKSPNIHLTIIGDGKEKEHLKNQIKSLKLERSITMTGWLPQNEIAKYYYDSSLFVSTSKTESFGLALTEAMSYGLPCLALSRASGARTQITNEIGVLLNTTNPATIASNIIELLQQPKKLFAYQLHIPAHLSHYSASVVHQAWSKILHP